MTYCYACDNCGYIERNVTLAKRNDQVCDCGRPLKRDMGAEMVSKETRIPLAFKHTAREFDPKHLEGTAPFSKERLKYAEETYGKGGRWV